ncbi:hypothetical protein LRR81_05150 [Metabacillus sp. GX 13764]|uniref:hypothetical protein n=1 Tax=Metabacillus kandeliae TaxID=2900151 RepID=UPI001E290F36|nr:hypothetical protein [Metabacillus kandeliae]MCD7033610.1 hypothetical protein [Metabacillus kandeliae]
MEPKELQQAIIQQYQKDEEMMILVFAQWCINHGLVPEDVYAKAYPNQQSNQALQHALSLTVPKEEAGDISFDTLLGVLSLYNNDDLAFAVSEEMENLKKKKRK